MGGLEELIADAVQTFSYFLLPGLVEFEKEAGKLCLFYVEVIGTSLNQKGEVNRTQIKVQYLK